MDCSEIRSLLSEYLDDALDAQSKAITDEHVRTCPACRQELASLKSLVRGIGSLQAVKAPADFLDQLHKRMERRSGTSKLRERLFYPLRVKIPLQLAGAAVMALLIFSILPLQQPSLKLPSKSALEKKAEDKAYDADESKGMIRDGRSQALVQKAAPPEPAKETREVALNLKKKAPAQATAEPSAPPASAQPGALDTQRKKMAVRAPLQEDEKEEALGKEAEPVLSVTKAVEAARGKVLSVDYNPQTGRPEFVHAEIPAAQISLLYERLKELGELQPPPETGTEKDSGLVHVKIKLIVSP